MIGSATMSRVAAWCILFTIRIASVINRVIYSVLECMCRFVDTVLLVYLSSSDSDVKFPVSSLQGKHDSTRREFQTNFQEIDISSELKKIKEAGRLTQKKRKAKKGNFIHKKSNSTENHLLITKKMKLNKFEKLILSYQFAEDRNDSSSSPDSTEGESENANKYNVGKAKETVNVPDALKQNISENELNVLKSENYQKFIYRDKSKSIKLDEESNSASYSEKSSTEFAENIPKNSFFKVRNEAIDKIDTKTFVSGKSNETDPERACVALENILCMNPSKVIGENVQSNRSLENHGIHIKQNVSKNKDWQNVSLPSHNIKQVFNRTNKNGHDTHTSGDASQIKNFKTDDFSGEIDLMTQYPKTGQIKNNQIKMHQNQKDTKMFQRTVLPKQYSADSGKYSIIVSVDEKTTDEFPIPKSSMPEITKPVLNEYAMESQGEEHAETQDIEKKDTETISQESNFEQVNETSTILDEIYSFEQTLTKQALTDSPKDSSSGISVSLETNVRQTLDVALDIKDREINNINSSLKDTQLEDVALTVPTGGIAARVGNQKEASESALDTSFNWKLRKEMDAKNKIEDPNMSSTSVASVDTSKNSLEILEDTDGGCDEIRNNFATILKMEEESAFKRKTCEEQFKSDGGVDGTDSVLMGYINGHFKDSDKQCTSCTTPHVNSSDESNSTPPLKKSEMTNMGEGETSTKIRPIEMKESLKVPENIQMEKKDTKASKTPELRELNEMMYTNSEVKQSLEQTLTVTSDKESSNKTLKLLLGNISEEILEKDKDEAVNENHEINNEKDISKKLTQKTDIKESTVVSSKTAVTCAKDKDKLSENGHNSPFNVKLKVENETKQSIANSLNSYDRHTCEDYIKLLDDTDQFSNEVRSNYKTVKKMEEECARKLKTYREQYYSDYEDKETDEAVMKYVNTRIKAKIRHPYEPTCTEPHGDLIELNSNKSQQEVPKKGKRNRRSRVGAN